MRSDRIRVGPGPIMSVLIRGKFRHRPTERRPREDPDTLRVMAEAESGVDTSTRPATPEVGKRPERLLLYRFREGRPCYTLDLDFRPAEL